MSERWTGLPITYTVTCTLCGQSWQQGSAEPGHPAQCLFCGHLGRLSVGPRSEETAHVEARLV
jgi:hypothetical protein